LPWQKLPPAPLFLLAKLSLTPVRGPSASTVRCGIPVAKAGPRQAEKSRQKADHSPLLLQTAANNAIFGTLEGN